MRGLTGNRPEWQDRAACRGMGPEVFYPRKGAVSTNDAKAICAFCAVRGACLEYALAVYSSHGDWGILGGITPRERRAIRRQRRGRTAA